MKNKLFVVAVTVALLILTMTGTAFADTGKSLPDIFQNYAGELEEIDIPVFLPTYLPGNGFYELINFRATKSGYSFEVVKADKNTPAVSMADSIVTVSAGDKPFSLYPLEDQILGKPAGEVQIHGVTANSYENGRGITWSEGVWKFTILGHEEQDGIGLAYELIRAMSDGWDLVPGAVQGKLRVGQLGNAMYVAASWTYDGQTWYTLDGRSTIEDRIKMLQSITEINDGLYQPYSFEIRKKSDKTMRVQFIGNRMYHNDRIWVLASAAGRCSL